MTLQTLSLRGAPGPALCAARGQAPRRSNPGASRPGPAPALSVFGAHLDVGTGGVLDRFELAVAGMARRHLAAGISRDPALPHRPPRIGHRGGGVEPFLRCRRVVVILPVAVSATRRVDHAG